VDPKLIRAAIVGSLAAAVVGAGALGLARAQSPETSPSPPPPPTPSEAPPAQAPETMAPPSNATAPVIVAPPDNESAQPVLDVPEAPAKPKAPPRKVEAEAVKPPEPPKPVRSPVAILQALDKVSAETIRFAAPVGRRVRYKSLVFTVRACETRNLDGPQPKAAAYLLVESQPRGAPGGEPPPAKRVYQGWMFATAPGIHPLQHPVYDAWLIACSAAEPPA